MSESPLDLPALWNDAQAYVNEGEVPWGVFRADTVLALIARAEAAEAKVAAVRELVDAQFQQPIHLQWISPHTLQRILDGTS